MIYKNTLIKKNRSRLSDDTSRRNRSKIIYVHLKLPPEWHYIDLKSGITCPEWHYVDPEWHRRPEWQTDSPEWQTEIRKDNQLHLKQQTERQKVYLNLKWQTGASEREKPTPER